MKIDLTDYKRFHWFEDSNGNKYDGFADSLPKDIDYFRYHVVNPCVYKNEYIEYTFHPEHKHEGNSFYHAMLQFRWFYNYMYKRMKNRGEMKTFKSLGTFNTTFNDGELIMAMVNSGDYTLGEAIYVYANSCERCLNVLTYKYLDGKDGYPEYSEKWKKCNTVCDWCRGEENEERHEV